MWFIELGFLPKMSTGITGAGIKLSSNVVQEALTKYINGDSEAHILGPDSGQEVPVKSGFKKIFVLIITYHGPVLSML